MYYLLLAVFYPVSLLPLWLLYRISDAAFFVIYHLMGYRKEVVRGNLTHAFPHKSAAEIEGIMHRFYRSFCDQWIETAKLLTISRRQLRRRMSGNWEVLRDAAAGGKNPFLLSGHQFNWEWAAAVIPLQVATVFAVVYLPLSSTAFDRLMLGIRTRTGSVMVSMKNLLGGFRHLRGQQHILTLAADQNPAVVEVAEWIPFMHRDAPFFRGPEQMPRRSGAPVVFIGIRKLRRGYYEATLEQLTPDAAQTPPGAILTAYVRFLERQLEAQPENYLWSHRRWKHKRPVQDAQHAD